MKFYRSFDSLLRSVKHRRKKIRQNVLPSNAREGGKRKEAHEENKKIYRYTAKFEKLSAFSFIRTRPKVVVGSSLVEGRKSRDYEETAPLVPPPATKPHHHETRSIHRCSAPSRRSLSYDVTIYRRPDLSFHATSARFFLYDVYLSRIYHPD